jgi:hypothetical protein
VVRQWLDTDEVELFAVGLVVSDRRMIFHPFDDIGREILAQFRRELINGSGARGHNLPATTLIGNDKSANVYECGWIHLSE